MAERNIITDKLVVEKTGKKLEDWYLFLDKKGAKKLSQENIFMLVNATPGLEPLGEWNQNLLVTSYCWSRGLKERGQREKGFEVSVSKTANVPVKILYKFWVNDTFRKKWMKEKILIRKCTENKSARISWLEDDTSLSVDFYPKGDDKAQVVVQHQKIKDKKTADGLKVFWQQKLEIMKKLLES